MIRRSARVVIVFASLGTAFGCGGAHVQQAFVGSPKSSGSLMMARDARSQGDTGAPPADHQDEPVRTQGWSITRKRTRFELRATNVFVDQVFGFGVFHGRIVGDPGGPSPTFESEIDTRSLRGGAPGFASFVRTELLEVGLYPRAKFEGTLRRRAGTDACVVDGTLSLHGVSRTLRFDAALDETAEALHLAATFDVPRKAFNIGMSGLWDTLLPESVRVSLDVYANREHVTVEEPE